MKGLTNNIQHLSHQSESITNFAHTKQSKTARSEITTKIMNKNLSKPPSGKTSTSPPGRAPNNPSGKTLKPPPSEASKILAGRALNVLPGQNSKAALRKVSNNPANEALDHLPGSSSRDAQRKGKGPISHVARPDSGKATDPASQLREKIRKEMSSGATWAAAPFMETIEIDPKAGIIGSFPAPGTLLDFDKAMCDHHDRVLEENGIMSWRQMLELEWVMKVREGCEEEAPVRPRTVDQCQKQRQTGQAQQNHASVHPQHKAGQTFTLTMRPGPVASIASPSDEEMEE